MLRVKNRDIHTIHGRLSVPSPGVDIEKLHLSRNAGKLVNTEMEISINNISLENENYSSFQLQIKTELHLWR